MIQINIATIPNQSLTFQSETAIYDLVIKEANGCMAATIVRDNTVILQNTRIVSGFSIIPYKYLENGNFFISTLNDELPHWSQFGISQFLFYLSQAELSNLRMSV